jgi:hypothetical protein
MNGEEGHRKCTAFEQSVEAMPTRLGFEIVDQGFSVKCFDPSVHQCNSHSVDILAKHVGPSPRLLKSFDGLTFFDCTSSQDISDTRFAKASKTLECLRKTDSYRETKGSIVVIARKTPPALRESLRSYSEIMCWDLDRISLYGTLATVNGLRGKKKYYSELDDVGHRSVIIVAWRPFQMPIPMQFYYAYLFYESDARLNRDNLRHALLNIKKMTWPCSMTNVAVRSLSGFTSDIPRVLDDVADSCSSLFRKIVIEYTDVYDHTRPWLAAFA